MLANRYDLDEEYKSNMRRLAQLMEQVAANTAATAATNQAMVTPAQETAANTAKHHRSLVRSQRGECTLMSL